MWFTASLKQECTLQCTYIVYSCFDVEKNKSQINNSNNHYLELKILYKCMFVSVCRLVAGGDETLDKAMNICRKKDEHISMTIN